MSRKSKITTAIKALDIDLVFDALNLELQNTETNYYYLYSYLHDHFKRLKSPLSYEDYVIGSHIVYAWMPTILQFKEHEEVQAKSKLITALELARNEDSGSETRITEEQLASIGFPFNGSLVAPSKFLHFLNPEAWPIWDSRVYRGLLKLNGAPNQSPHHYEMQDSKTFVLYVNTLRSFASSPKIEAFKRKHHDLQGLSNLRCLELGLFIAGDRSY